MTARRGDRATRTDPTFTAPDLFHAARRGAALAIVLAVVLGVGAYVVSSRSTPIYSAQVGVIATQPGSQYGDLNIITPPTVDASVYQSAVLSGDVVAEALTRLDGQKPSEERLIRFLESVRVRVDASQRSSTVWIEVRNASAPYAAAAVNAIADELVVWDRERARRALDRSIAAIERSIADIDAELADADAARVGSLTALREQRMAELQTATDIGSTALVVGLLEPLRTAPVPIEPVAPRERFAALVGVLLGLVLGYAVQILAWTLDARVGGGDTVMTGTGLPVLVEFPTRPRRTKRHSAEAAGFFHTNVALATRGSHPRTIVVTSPMRPNEKEGVAVSLAENFARSGQRTLLVDADLRHPGVTEWLEMASTHTTTFDAYLADPELTDAPIAIAIGGAQSFDFIPSLTAQRFPVDLLIAGFERSLKRWTDAYDVVVFDAAPVVPFADTLTLAPTCTGVVLCASARRSRRPQLDEALLLLERPGVTVLGVAITDVRGGQRWADEPKAGAPVKMRPSPPIATARGRSPRRS